MLQFWASIWLPSLETGTFFANIPDYSMTAVGLYMCVPTHSTFILPHNIFLDERNMQ